MPWTFAHPAAVIPLRKYCPRPLSFPALVVGSITPDLCYHIQRKDWSSYAHTLEGSLLVCLPLGLVLLALFCLLRKPIWYLLPDPHRTAFAPVVAARPPVSPALLPGAAISIVLGAWTHIAWDSLTHADGWIVVRVPWLQGVLFAIDGVPFPVSQVLQHISSYLGLAVLAIAYWRWLHRVPEPAARPYFRRDDAWRYRMLAIAGAGAICIGLTLAAYAAAQFHGYLAFRTFVFRGAVDGMSAFFALYLFSSVLCYLTRRTA